MTQVSPQTHETEGHLFYGPVNAGQSEATDYDGLDLYHALVGTLINDGNGYIEVPDATIDGESFEIQLTYSDSGIAPRPSDSIAADVLKELDLHLDGHGERKVNFNNSPRFPGMQTPDGDSISTPFDHTDADEGVDIHFQASNIEIDELPSLYARALFEVFDAVDKGLYHGYIDGPFGGNITAVERYVRISRSMNEKLIGTGGVMDRLAMLLSDASGTKGVYKWDNKTERGYHHVIRHGSTSATQLVSQHRLGGQLKSYLPEHPEEFSADDPLYHPKVGAKFVAGRSAGGAVRWADRHEVGQELDERLLSILSWADIPVEAGGTAFVADDHFGSHAVADPVPLHSDPLPQLETQQEHLLLTCLRDMTPADQDIVETLTTDGGTDARDLSDETGLSLSTIYRCLDRMDGVLTSDNGHVRFVTDRLRREVRAIFESVEHQIETAADRVAEIVDQDVRQSASSAFDRWLAKYGAEFEAPETEGERPVVRIDTVLSRLKFSDHPMLEDVLDEMGTAWKRDGRLIDQLRDAIVEVVVDGKREQHRAATLW